MAFGYGIDSSADSYFFLQCWSVEKIITQKTTLEHVWTGTVYCLLTGTISFDAKVSYINFMKMFHRCMSPTALNGLVTKLIRVHNRMVPNLIQAGNDVVAEINLAV